MIDSQICPVCGYPHLVRGPIEYGTSTFEICSSCGFEFGFDDGVNGDTYETYRARWILAGCLWWSKSGSEPPDWDPRQQLKNIDVILP